MSNLPFFPSSHTAFSAVLREIRTTVNTDTRLPEWPFKAQLGHAYFCQFSYAIEGAFGPVLEKLAHTYEDASVNFVVLDPAPNYYRENYGCYPAFATPTHSISEGFWQAVSHEPVGDPTGSPTFTANVVAAVGTSGSWALWAERAWDLAIVLTQREAGSWLSAGVEFVPVETALANYTEPDFKVRLRTHVREEFLRNVQERGSVN